MTGDREQWLIVEAKRDDGTPTMFRIRELEPQKQLTKIFVVELPYPKTDSLSRLPSVSDYRRLAEFDEQWLRPACTLLGWQFVGSKTEDGSFFLYLYGASDPGQMIAKLSPFDAALGFYDDDDPEWQEYCTLRQLLDQAKAIPPLEQQLGATPTVPNHKPKPKTAKRKPAKAAAVVIRAQARGGKKRPAVKAKSKPGKSKRR